MDEAGGPEEDCWVSEVALRYPCPHLLPVRAWAFLRVRVGWEVPELSCGSCGCKVLKVSGASVGQVAASYRCSVETEVPEGLSLPWGF